MKWLYLPVVAFIVAAESVDPTPELFSRFFAACMVGLWLALLVIDERERRR